MAIGTYSVVIKVFSQEQKPGAMLMRWASAFYGCHTWLNGGI